MKKITLVFALLLIITVLSMACNNADMIVCGNCSATTPREYQHCANCGTALYQSGLQKPTESKNDKPPISNSVDEYRDVSEANLLDILQGHWAYANEWDGCEVVTFTQDQVVPWTYPTGGGGPTATIKNITAKGHNFEVTLYYPAGYDQGDYYPESEELCYFSSSDNYTSKLNIRFANGEQNDYVFVGKTESEYKINCDKLIAENSKEIPSDKNDNVTINTDISADTWYYFKANNAVHFQNADIQNAVSMSKGTVYMITYYPICRDCHIQGNAMRMKGVAKDIPLTETYYCQSCEATTYIRIKIVD